MGVMDFLWLGTVAKKFYRREMGELLRKKPNMTAALIFYAIYVCGVVFFAVSQSESWLEAVGRGAALGLIAYATYDLTNLATIKGFSAKVAAIDIAWGTALTSVVAGVTYLVVNL